MPNELRYKVYDTDQAGTPNGVLLAAFNQESEAVKYAKQHYALVVDTQIFKFEQVIVQLKADQSWVINNFRINFEEYVTSMIKQGVKRIQLNVEAVPVDTTDDYIAEAPENE